MKAGLKKLNRREFMSIAATGAAVASVPSLALQGWSAPAVGVPKSRLDRLAKGANVCRWFRFIKEEDAEHFGNYISESEARLMRQMGLTHIRLCLQPKVIMDQETGAIREKMAVFVDSAILRFQRAGLLVVVDVHNEDRPSELNPSWQEAFVRFWTDFAARLKHFDPELTVLEIINEPVFKDREAEWNNLNARLASAIRQSAPEHTIMTSGSNWGGIDGLRKLKILPDRNVVYSFHCYDPFPFTHQGATWAGPDVKPLRGVPYPSSPEAVAPLLADLAQYPGSARLIEKYGKDSWSKVKLAARFKEGMEWGARNGVPLYCGEFGVFPPYAKPEHRSNWFHDFGEVLAENHVGWAVWGWDEGFGLNRKYVAGAPEVDKSVAAALGLNAV